MFERPLLSILDRDEAVRQAASAFKSQLEMLVDLTNYGSNLIIRSFNSSPGQLDAIIVCGVLLKQVVSMVDAVETLVRNGQTHAAFLPARAAFEASLYLQWILISDTDRKATAYMVSNYRNDRLWASRAIKGSSEAEAFDEVTRGLNMDMHENNPHLDELAQAQLNEVNRILAQGHFASLDAEFEALKQSDRRKNEPSWYKPFGIKTLRQLAKQLGRLPDYSVFYGKGSQVTHSATYKDHLYFTKGQVHFTAIRNFKGLHELLLSIMGTAIASYKAVLAYYRPAELPAFGRKYLEDWQKHLLAVAGSKGNDSP